MQPELWRGSCRDVWRFEWLRLTGMEREDVLLTRGVDGWYNPALQSQSQQQTAFSYRSSLRVDVKIFLFLAAANLISHLQLGKTQPVLAETQKAPFCCCSPTPTKWWFWKARISENDVSLTPDSWFFCNCPPPPPVKYTWTEGRKEQSERSTVTCAHNPVSYSQGKKSKHNSMPTKRELYQRSNLFHTMRKPLADRKELCFPLHAFIWLLLVMQQGKKKRSLFPKVHRMAEATHHLWECRRAHPGLRPCRALLIGTSVNIQQPGPPGSPSVALWSAVLHVWWFHPGNPQLASKWKNSLLCRGTACLAESKAAMAAGFLYSRLKCHDYSPPRGKGKTY